MQQQQQTRPSYDLFLHNFVDNEQAKSVTFMKLDSHPTIYREGTQNRYLTNLIIAGRNYIEVLAIFQNQITVNMGTWYLYEDIIQVQQWDKNIVISTKSKIVGLIYQDCMIKNSFMLSLQFLQLGYRQYIQTICDKMGFYMLIATSRQILLCISQKAITKYKSRPFLHMKCSIMQQDIKWNRPEYQSISEVLKYQFFDYQLSKVESFHFCEQYCYFIGYNEKSNIEKHLFEMPIHQVFSDNQKQPLIIKIIKIQSQVKLLYLIRKQHQTQFIKIKTDNSIYLSNQKGEFAIQNKLFSTDFNNSNIQLFCKKSNNPNIFPLQIYYKNSLYIYERTPISTIGSSIPSNFNRRVIKLPQSIQVEYCDVQDNLFAYCNNYQVGLVFLRGNLNLSLSASDSISKQGEGQSQSMIQQNQQNKGTQLIKTVLKQSYGNIVDFNIGQNLLILQNTYKKKSRLRLLRKSIIEHPKPFIMHPKKMALEAMPQIKTIRSLEDLLNDYQMTQPENQLHKLKTFLQNYLIIQNKNDVNSLYRIVENHKFQLILTDFQYCTLIKNKQYNLLQKSTQYQFKRDGWYLLFWFGQNYLGFYQLDLAQQSLTLQLAKKVQNVQLWKYKNVQPYIRKFKDYLTSIYQQQGQLSLYKWSNNTVTTIKLPNQANNKKNIIIKLEHKNITFKRKDKDQFYLQAIMILDGRLLQIWQIHIDSGTFKLSQWTQNIGQGLAIILPSESNYLNNNICMASHEYRAITCPQYVLTDKSIHNPSLKSPSILKTHTIQYQGQSFLFMINSLQQLQVYKKQYCTANTNKQNPIFGLIQSGYFYYRQPIQLNIVKKFKYNEKNAFVQIGCGILKVCNLVFFKGELLEFPENIRTCFEMEGEIWAIFNDNKIKLLITHGKIVSHHLTVDIPSYIKQEMVGIQATNQNYVVYSRSGFEVFDKQLNSTWKFNPNDFTDNKQQILAICAYDHYVCVSYFNYCEDQSKKQYQSIKFKIRIYNTITKKKIIQKDSSFEEPVLHIRYVAPDKLILVTSSNVSVNIIKNNQTLENLKNKHYSKRGMNSSFSYVPERLGTQPGYMLFGGLYGGLNFYAGQWITQDKLDEICFQNLKSGIDEVQIFRYGGQLEMLKALVADNSQNIIVLDLIPKNAKKIADFHIGSRVNSIKKRYQIPYMACSDGCIRMLLPIKLRDTDINFLDLQQQICKSMPLLAGFNNRDSRFLDQRQRTYKITSTGNMIDGSLIRNFLISTETLKNLVYENSNMELQDIKNQLLSQI